MSEWEKNPPSSALEKCFKTAMEQVLRLKTLCVENYPAASNQPGERAVAALDFRGDYTGRIILTLPEDQIEPITKHIQQVFMTDSTPEQSLVFAEILNIYAGCLTVQMQKLGRTIEIGPPLLLQDGQTLREPGTRVIKMITDGQLEFQFGLVLNEPFPAATSGISG